MLGSHPSQYQATCTPAGVSCSDIYCSPYHGRTTKGLCQRSPFRLAHSSLSTPQHQEIETRSNPRDVAVDATFPAIVSTHCRAHDSFPGLGFGPANSGRPTSIGHKRTLEEQVIIRTCRYSHRRPHALGTPPSPSSSQGLPTSLAFSQLCHTRPRPPTSSPEDPGQRR